MKFLKNYVAKLIALSFIGMMTSGVVSSEMNRLLPGNISTENLNKGLEELRHKAEKAIGSIRRQAEKAEHSIRALVEKKKNELSKSGPSVQTRTNLQQYQKPELVRPGFIKLDRRAELLEQHEALKDKLVMLRKDIDKLDCAALTWPAIKDHPCMYLSQEIINNENLQQEIAKELKQIDSMKQQA